MHNGGASKWRLHTNLYKVASTNNSETMYCADLRFGEVIHKSYCLLQYSRFLAFFIERLRFYLFIFCCVTVKMIFKIPYDFRVIILRDPKVTQCRSRNLFRENLALGQFHSKNIIVATENLYLFFNLKHKHFVRSFAVRQQTEA